MSNQVANRDENNVPTLLAVSSSDGSSILRLYADPTTHRLLVTGSGTSPGFQQPTGTVDGSNQTFVFTSAPNAISVDGNTIQKVSSDTTVNWTGTTTVVLTIAPTYDVFGVN